MTIPAAILLIVSIPSASAISESIILKFLIGYVHYSVLIYYLPPDFGCDEKPKRKSRGTKNELQIIAKYLRADNSKVP